MAEVLLFHHIQGVTTGVVAFADRLREAGHTVHTPDLYGGRTFDSIAEGAAYVTGAEPDLDGMADAAADALPDAVVYAGISSGVMSAQRLAQTRPGAKGALLLESCIPITGDWAFGPWPDGLPAQIHGMDDDDFFAKEGDIDAARQIVASVPDVELFVYPGNSHLFEDNSLASYVPDATDLMVQRILEFLARVDQPG